MGAAPRRSRRAMRETIRVFPSLFLGRVDPGEGDDQPHDQHEEEGLDPDRHPDQAARAPCAGPAALAVSGIRLEPSPASITGDLDLLHATEYVVFAEWSYERRSPRRMPSY